MENKEPKINLGSSKGRRTLDSLSGFGTSIGTDNTIKGSITGPGHCIVLGRVEGSSTLNGTLVIGETASWLGDIVAENIVIAGEVTGNITARKKMEIVSSARIKGNLNSPYIAIAEGAVYDGEVNMTEVKRFSDQRES